MSPGSRLSTISLRHTEARCRVEHAIRRTDPGPVGAPSVSATPRPEENAGQTSHSCRPSSTDDRASAHDRRQATTDHGVGATVAGTLVRASGRRRAPSGELARRIGFRAHDGPTTGRGVRGRCDRRGVR